MKDPFIDIGNKELIELLNRCWMTHDGMWFFHCAVEFGMVQANKMNKAAIKSLAPLETRRIKEALAFEKERIGTFQEFKEFIIGVHKLLIPEFMNAIMSFTEKDTLHWEFKPLNCFAYKGMKRAGVIDQYECGVIYRLECWFDSLGLSYEVVPKIDKCSMMIDGTCAGNFVFNFS